MLSIPCPWCGPRDEIEFTYGGEANVSHPHDPERLDDAEWSRYLFVRANPAGAWSERWCHTAGCRRWFAVSRDTTTQKIRPSDPLRKESEQDAAAD